MKQASFTLFSVLLILSMVLAACTPAATPTPAPKTQAPAVAASPTTAPPPTVAPTKAPEPTKAPAATTAPTKAAEPTKPPAAPTATVVPTATIVAAAAGATKITFWHSMGGDIGGTAIPTMANEFNASQQKCHVTPIYQGSYDDSLNKLRAGLQSKDTPAVIQLFDLATRQMIDLKVITPVQTYIDKEKYEISDLEKNVLGYYSVDNKLYSMPFNTSNPMLYFNVDMFKAAGLDPAKPPRTFAEVTEAARKLTKKDASGKVTVYGANFAIYGWFFEQLLAVSGADYVDNGNGRTKFATKAIFNSLEGINVLTWWKAMIDEGIMLNTGRPTVNSRNAFLAGQAAMILESTAALRGLMDGAKGKFELGTAFLPRPNEDAFKKSGTIIGGASLWIISNRPQAEQDCAWEFTKFQASPKMQAYWHTQTGYYPIRKAAYDEPLDKEWVAKYPQFKTAVDQLHAAPLNTYTQGGLIGVFPVARQTIETAIEEVLAGKATPKDALDKAAKSVTDAIVEYNLTMGLK
jgi:sn-glycerol 3-phosphate transport system substrate-binding protein